MSNSLPQIYWYVFWLVVLFVFTAFQVYVATIRHRRNMKVLEILKTYAEKGAEPPAAIADQLAKKIADSDHNSPVSEKTTSPQERRSELLGLFIGFAFASCVAWGLKQWLVSVEGAKWATYASQAAFAFFGLGAAGFLILALLTRDK
jgi:hypothetical protein